jgi:hypothetical protein
MTKRTALCAALICLTGLGALTACTSHQNSSAPLVVPAATTSAKALPPAEPTARELLDKAVQDMRASGAVTAEITGRYEFSPMRIKATAGTSGRCAITADLNNGDSLRAVATGGPGAYLRGNEAFWSDIADTSAAHVTELAGSWGRLTPAEFTDTGLEHFCVLDEMLGDLTAEEGNGTLRKGAPISLDGGQRVIPLIRTVGGHMTSVFVSTGSTPYVVRSEVGEEGYGLVSVFTGFGRQPHVSTPPHPRPLLAGDLGGDDGFHV